MVNRRPVAAIGRPCLGGAAGHIARLRSPLIPVDVSTRAVAGSMDSGGRLALVTGAAGFIGSHLVEALVGKGWRVRCFVLSFIALHHLDSRPLVIGAEEQLTVTNSAMVGDVDVQADGQKIGVLPPGRSITVSLGGSEVHLATFPEASFFRRYREKFGRP